MIRGRALKITEIILAFVDQEWRIWTYAFNCFGSLPAMISRTMLLAIASVSFGSFAKACLRAASASSNRPRWISATACEIKLWFADVDGACASSSKT